MEKNVFNRQKRRANILRDRVRLRHRRIKKRPENRSVYKRKESKISNYT